MREISVDKIVSVIKELCIEANYYLNDDIISAFDQAIKKENTPTGKEILLELKENAKISSGDQIPLCQDTGLVVVFIEIGQDVHVTGGLLTEAVNEGVRQGYNDGYLRKSICHPLTRKNTGNNTPAVIHYNIVSGEKITIKVVTKGGGSENMSRIAMLTPAEGIDGIKKFVINTVKEAGANPCPPVIIGIGIGGNFEQSAILSKRALLRKIGSRNPDTKLSRMELDILDSINKLGIGPMGYGGTITCMDVFIELKPCHIASLPVAVNINCHSARHKEAVI